MTIHLLTPTLEHRLPDLDVIRSNLTQLKRQTASLDDLYLPVVNEKIKALYKHVGRVEDDVLAVLEHSLVSLRSINVNTVLQLILETKTDSPLRPGYMAELTDAIDSALENVTRRNDALLASLDMFETFDTGSAGSFAVDTQKQLESKQADLALIKLRYVRTQADKDAISTAMLHLEEQSFIDELRPLLKALMYMDPRNPAYAAIRAGVVGATNILRIASEAMKYSDMVEARAEVQKVLLAIEKEQRDAQQDIQTLNTRHEQLSALEPIAHCRKNYEQELRKITYTLGAFLTAQQNLSRTDMLECARIFIAQANDMATYLEDLSQRWN